MDRSTKIRIFCRIRFNLHFYFLPLSKREESCDLQIIISLVKSRRPGPIGPPEPPLHWLRFHHHCQKLSGIRQLSTNHCYSSCSEKLLLTSLCRHKRHHTKIPPLLRGSRSDLLLRSVNCFRFIFGNYFLI